MQSMYHEVHGPGSHGQIPRAPTWARPCVIWRMQPREAVYSSRPSSNASVQEISRPRSPGPRRGQDFARGPGAQSTSPPQVQSSHPPTARPPHAGLTGGTNHLSYPCAQYQQPLHRGQANMLRRPVVPLQEGVVGPVQDPPIPHATLLPRSFDVRRTMIPLSLLVDARRASLP